MNPPDQPAQAANVAGHVHARRWTRECVVFAGDQQFALAAGKAYDDNAARPKAKLMAWVTPNSDPYIGFLMEFPLGNGQTSNRKNGCGVRYRSMSPLPMFRSSSFANLIGTRHGDELTADQFDHHKLIVKFPRNGTDMDFSAASRDLVSRFPRANVEGNHTLVSVVLKENAMIKVDGYGWIFYNYLAPRMAAWLNENDDTFAGITLQSFLEGRRFSFIVPDRVEITQKVFHDDTLPEPWQYPYGVEHVFDPARYGPLLRATKSEKRFLAALEYVQP